MTRREVPGVTVLALQMCVSLAKQMVEECKTVEGADELLGYLQSVVTYGEAHLKVIARWGRFPHRNKVLGRDNTPEEAQALEQGSIPKF